MQKGHFRSPQHNHYRRVDVREPDELELELELERDEVVGEDRKEVPAEDPYDGLDDVEDAGALRVKLEVGALRVEVPGLFE